MNTVSSFKNQKTSSKAAARDRLGPKGRRLFNLFPSYFSNSKLPFLRCFSFHSLKDTGNLCTPPEVQTITFLSGHETGIPNILAPWTVPQWPFYSRIRLLFCSAVMQTEPWEQSCFGASALPCSNTALNCTHRKSKPRTKVGLNVGKDVSVLLEMGRDRNMVLRETQKAKLGVKDQHRTMLSSCIFNGPLLFTHTVLSKISVHYNLQQTYSIVKIAFFLSKIVCHKWLQN